MAYGYSEQKRTDKMKEKKKKDKEGEKKKKKKKNHDGPLEILLPRPGSEKTPQQQHLIRYGVIDDTRGPSRTISTRDGKVFIVSVTPDRILLKLNPPCASSKPDA